MDHYQRSARNTFAALGLDRATELRNDQAWLEQQINSTQARFLPIYNNSCILDPNNPKRPLLLDYNPSTEQSALFLGNTDRRSYFSIQLDTEHPLLSKDADYLGLRQAASLFDDELSGLCAYALALHQWQTRHRFCSACGHQNEIQAAGHRLQCSHTSCKQDTFPRIDPAMIVLVTYQNQCLLGRQASWPKKRYSCLAGFVEPAESLEDAVRREVMEEAGVSLDQIHYHSSQPWPFPASIMLGFTATASQADICIGDELEDARWWSISDMQTAITQQQLRLPYSLSISWQLLADWYHQQTGQSLTDFNKQYKQ